VRLEFRVSQLRLRAPWVTSSGALTERSLVQVGLTGEDGVTGYGEAAPLPGYDGVTVAEVIEALEAWTPGGELPALPQAAAAIDLAQWDLAGRRAGQPVWRLLGADEAPAVRVNATIGAEPPAAAAALARKARAAGFTCVKVKVGDGDELVRVATVREVVERDVAIRLDAGGAWDPGQAAGILHSLAELDIELCEEPVHGVEELERVALTSPCPIAADETNVLSRRVCDAVCLKIASSGGITGVIRDAERARALGYEVYLASTLDGPLGIAAALHAAAIVEPDRACGLATLDRFEATDPLPPIDGVMTAPGGPGLGLRQFS